MIDLSSTKQAVTKIILKAGDIVKKYYKSEDFEHHEKSEIDVVTQVDLEIDAFLQKKLHKSFPFSTFLTEETAPKDFSSLKTAEQLWIIDPIDGTVNFSRQNPNFAISIALVNNSETQLGVIYSPIPNNLYSAQIDQEHALLNNQPIRVSQTNTLKKSVVGCDWSWNLEKRILMAKWLQTVSQKVRQIKSMGSCVCDVASLTEGKLDVYMLAGAKPWDIAAVSLLLTKAGGTITKPNGEEWNIFDSDFVATNGFLHSFMLELLQSA